jgi:hypothetical protein
MNSDRKGAKKGKKESIKEKISREYENFVDCDPKSTDRCICLPCKEFNPSGANQSLYNYEQHTISDGHVNASEKYLENFPNFGPVQKKPKQANEKPKNDDFS